MQLTENEDRYSIPADCSLDVNDAGHLTIDWQDTVDLANKFGTPLWVVSESTVRSNFRIFRAAFRERYPNVTIAYASKANHSPAILKIMSDEGASLDCVSLTQLKLAQAAGMPFGRVVFNGNNKSEEELEYALTHQIGMINVDSLDELSLLGHLAEKLGKKARINIRVRGGYSRLSQSDPDFVKAYTSDDKFGIDIPSEQALEAFNKALKIDSLEVLGISHHVGWSAYGIPYDSNLDLMRLEVEVEEVVDFAKQLKAKLGFVPSTLDLGGGFRKKRPHGFGPRRITSFPSIDEYAETITNVIKRRDNTKAIGLPNLVLEPGGYMVSDAVTLLSRVGGIKAVDSGPGAGKWVAVDSSAYAFVRKLIFTFYHHTLVANKIREPPTEVVDLVGPTCAYDNIGDKVSVPFLQRGDLIATLDQGSYCETISSQYCGFPRPATILVNKDQARLIKRRETADDIIGQYIVLEKPDGLM